MFPPMQGMREVFQELSKDELVDMVLKLSEDMGKLQVKPGIPHIISKLPAEFDQGIERKYEEREFADRTYKSYFRRLFSLRFTLHDKKDRTWITGTSLPDQWLGIDTALCRYQGNIIITASKAKQAKMQIVPLVDLMLQQK